MSGDRCPEHGPFVWFCRPCNDRQRDDAEVSS